MSMYVNHAPRLETHSRMHASAYQYMHMDIYTHICMCISMCIFVMRGDSRHIRIYTRACCASAHLFTNMYTYPRICHAWCTKTRDTLSYAYVHASLVHIYIWTWTPTRAYVHVYVYVCVYSWCAETRDTFAYAYVVAVRVHIYLGTCTPIRAHVYMMRGDWRHTLLCIHAYLTSAYLCMNMHTPHAHTHTNVYVYMHTVVYMYVYVRHARRQMYVYMHTQC